MYRADRVLRRKGGVAIYVKASLVVSTHEIYSSSFCEAAMIHVETINTIIVGVYRPPPNFSDPKASCPSEHFRALCNQIYRFASRFPTATTFITGDFNLPCIDWSLGEIRTGGNVTIAERECATALLRLREDLFLQQIVEEPTRRGKASNILDLFFTNNEQLIQNVQVVGTSLSDHDLVSIRLRTCELPGISDSPTPSPKVFKHPPPIFDSINIMKTDWVSVRDKLDEVDWGPIYAESDQNRAWDLFITKVGGICSQFAPYKGPSARVRRPRIPRDRLILLRRKRKLHARLAAVKSRASNNSERILSLYSQIGDIELAMRKSILEEDRRAENLAIHSMKSNPKLFYSYINRKKSCSSIGPLRKPSGELTSDPADMANLLQDQFVSVFSSPSPGDQTVPTAESSPSLGFKLNEISITTSDILLAIKEMPSSAAPGPDKFPCIVLKECAMQLAPVLCQLWNASFDSGQTADIFKRQSIVPLFKKGNRGLPSNYRPVSLTSHLCKLFERVVRKQMTSYFEENNLISNDQHGFRAGRSCLTQLIDHLDSILKGLESDDNIDVLFLDMSKAFDKVSHSKLLEKLAIAGIGGKLLSWLESFLVGRTQCVVVEGVTSRAEVVKSGVPQGTVLAPLLFLLYVNDMSKVLMHSTMKLFADDAKLKKNIKSEHDRSLLLEDMGRVNKWAFEHSMELNAQKYQLLQHGRNESLKSPYQLPDGTIVKRDDHVRDLGILVDPDLSFKSHISHVIKSATLTAGKILRTFETREIEPMLILFKSYVRPHLEYISPVWSPHLIGEIQRIEGVQRAFTSRLNGCEGLNYWQRLRYLGIYSLQRRRERYKILYVWKMYRGLLPNHLNLDFKFSVRRGPYIERPLGKSSLKSINSSIFNSCTSTAVALFNTIPKEVKLQGTLEGAKRELDRFLKNIPDEPPIKGYGAVNSNSLSEWLPYRGAVHGVS